MPRHTIYTYCFLWVLSAVLLSSCSSSALHEAEEVVRQSDSLWHQGQMNRDSVQLAQAYQTLSNWQWFYADEYAHACYHYGRLLREKDNPVAAMECFINATHVHTHDYHILGRVYNNMGDICHRASVFDLSYNMFKRSAEIFLSDNDTLSYYYCLNDMAYELAEQGKKDEAFEILASIECHCSYEEVLVKIFETKAVACLYAQAYDSVIYYTSLYINEGNDPNGILLRAQAYSFMGENDSATYYADSLLVVATELNNISNALYILTNNDVTKDVDAIREVAADRADAQKIIEVQRSKLAQAVQLLDQDLYRKPNFVWLYAVFSTLFIVGAVIMIYISRKRRQYALLSQRIKSVQAKHNEMTKHYVLNQTRIKEEIEHNCELLRNDSNIKQTLAWNSFEAMCTLVDQQFCMLASKLRSMHVLNEKEIRLCVLVLINISRVRISETLPYALSSVGKLKDHTAKLLGTTGKNLHDYLIKLVIEG